MIDFIVGERVLQSIQYELGDDQAKAHGFT